MTKLRVQEVAKEKGFNIMSLARETKLDIRLVRRYWHNQVNSVSLTALDEMAAVLGVHFFDLFDTAPTGDTAPAPSKKN
jgi:transcriptional regulator with XRE-family HTH domain